MPLWTNNKHGARRSAQRVPLFDTRLWYSCGAAMKKYDLRGGFREEFYPHNR